MRKQMWTTPGVAVTGFTGAAPQTVAGALLVTRELKNISALVYVKATTNTLTVTAKWQVSNDGSTFYDAYGPNRATNVAIATGTGSAVTDTVSISAPDSVYGHLYCRCIAVSGTGSGGGAGVDEASITYYGNKDTSL